MFERTNITAMRLKSLINSNNQSNVNINLPTVENIGAYDITNRRVAPNEDWQ